jgi:hypothetical protein
MRSQTLHPAIHTLHPTHAKSQNPAHADVDEIEKQNRVNFHLHLKLAFPDDIFA